MNIARLWRPSTALSFVAAALAVAVALTLVARPVEAAAGVTLATGGGAISVDTAATATTPAWTMLTGPILITEAVATDFAIGASQTLIFSVPAGFEFNPAPAVTVASTGADLSVVTPATVTSTTITVTYTVTGTATNLDTIKIGDPAGVAIQLRPTAGTAATGSITRTGGTGVIAGVVATTPVGTLTSVVGAASKLAVTTQPSASTVAGVAIATQPIVTVQDQFGNTTTGDTSTVTLALTTGTGTLSGTASMAAVAGVADFVGKGLSIDLAGTNKVLTASAPSRTSATTSAFTITHAAAAKLGLTTAPSASTAPNVAFAQQPVVAIQDAFGNTVTTDNTTVVTAALNAGTGTLAGTKTETATAGVASFAGNDLAIDLVGTDKVLRFTSSPVYTQVDSASFTIATPVISLPPAPPKTTEPGISVALQNVETVAASETAEVVLNSVASGGSAGKVTVPAAALPTGSTVKVGAISNVADLTAKAKTPAGVDLVLGFSITATDATGGAVTGNFGSPVNLEFTVSAASLPAGAGAGELRIAVWNGSAWVPLTSVVTLNADGTATISASMEHFSLYSVVYDAAGFGRITGEVPASGFSIVSFGGSTAELEAALVAAGCTKPAFTTNNGAWVSYLANAPFAAINADFNALFSEGVPLGRGLILNNCS